MRVEAASWRGKAVFFRVIGPWSKPERMQAVQPDAFDRALIPVLLALSVLAALLAWRNFRAGRGDIRGGSRLAAFVFGVELLEWLCIAHHVSTIDEVDLLVGGVSWAGFSAGFVWMLYLALEPYVRRRWPYSMVTWSRLLGGGFRDPLVGGHLLAGVALGIALSLCASLGDLTLERFGPIHIVIRMSSLLGARRMAGLLLSSLISAIMIGLVLILLFFLLRVLLRRQWLAAAAFALLFTGIGILQFGSHLVTGALIEALTVLFLIAGMLRFGVLSIVLAAFTAQLLASYPLTTDFSAWYAGGIVLVVAILLALTAYAFHTAVAGRPLFQAGFLEPD